MRWAVMQCAVMQCAVMQWAVMQRAVMQCAVIQCAVMQWAVMQCAVMQCAVMQWAVMRWAVMQCAVMQCAVMQFAVAMHFCRAMNRSLMKCTQTDATRPTVTKTESVQCCTITVCDETWIYLGTRQFQVMPNCNSSEALLRSTAILYHGEKT